MVGAPSQGAMLGRRDGWRVSAGPLVQLIGVAVSPGVAAGGDFAERALIH